MMLKLLVLYKVGNFFIYLNESEILLYIIISYFLKHEETVSSILLVHDVASKGNQISMF